MFCRARSGQLSVRKTVSQSRRPSRSVRDSVSWSLSVTCGECELQIGPCDPDILDAAPGAETRPAGLSDTVDVLVVGAGPAGMLLAAQLSTFPGIGTRIVERREGPLQVGQADGIACRTVETFDAFGLSE